MYSYEAPKKLGYPKTVFYDDGLTLTYKDGREVTINAREIERIEYVKPSLWSFLGATVLFGGTFPGRLEIHLHENPTNSLMNSARTSTVYLVKIAYKNICRLPAWCKQKIGYETYFDNY